LYYRLTGCKHTPISVDCPTRTDEARQCPAALEGRAHAAKWRQPSGKKRPVGSADRGRGEAEGEGRQRARTKRLRPVWAPGAPRRPAMPLEGLVGRASLPAVRGTCAFVAMLGNMPAFYQAERCSSTARTSPNRWHGLRCWCRLCSTEDHTLLSASLLTFPSSCRMGNLAKSNTCQSYPGTFQPHQPDCLPQRGGNDHSHVCLHLNLYRRTPEPVLMVGFLAVHRACKRQGRLL